MSKTIYEDIILQSLRGLRDEKHITQDKLTEIMRLLTKPEQVKDNIATVTTQSVKSDFGGVDLE